MKLSNTTRVPEIGGELILRPFFLGPKTPLVCNLGRIPLFNVFVWCLFGVHNPFSDDAKWPQTPIFVVFPGP